MTINWYHVITIFCLIIFYHPSIAQTIDTVDTYIHLKIYTGGKDSVYINHERYYGLFIRDTCTIEDYGTKILTNSGCWKRVYRNLSPRFWDIGGLSPDSFIGSVRREIDAINSAAIVAYNNGGDTIEIDSLYIIDRPIFLLKNNTYLGTTDSAGFQRINPPKTILTDTVFFADSKIMVENNHGFRTLQKINIANGIAYDSIAGHVSYRASVSIPLGGDTTIFLSGLAIQKQMLPGDSVSLFFPMMTPRFSGTDSIFIKNLIFDGNRQHYNLNYDWRINTTIDLPTTTHTIIEQCRFYNIPTENIFLCGAIVKDCSGMDLNGSIIHFSCGMLDKPTEVIYNDFSSTNEVGDSLMNHSEAGLTFSSKVQHLRMAYNTFTQLEEYGVGIFGNDDVFNEITDNLLESKLETIVFHPFYLYRDSNLIYNNKNPNFANLSEDSCFLDRPEFVHLFPCQGNSTWRNALGIGDTITITLDSFSVLNSNENFIKCIQAIYDTTFFKLVNASLNTPGISSFHHWDFEESSTECLGLVFDNGHRNGKYGDGNWGYEPCGQNGKCQALTFSFMVTTLPDSTSAVACPLKGLQIRYDGEMQTWAYPIYCQNEPIYFNDTLLGQPILEGNPVSSLKENSTFSTIQLYPNPSQHSIYIQDFVQSNTPYQVLNPMGQVIQKGVLTDNKINIHYLPSGIYVLRFWLEYQYYSAIFVKK